MIVLAEMPGITPRVLDFAWRIADLGCTAVVPHLFGVARADPISSPPRAALLVARAGAQICISREFAVWATGATVLSHKSVSTSYAASSATRLSLLS